MTKQIRKREDESDFDAMHHQIPRSPYVSNRYLRELAEGNRPKPPEGEDPEGED